MGRGEGGERGHICCKHFFLNRAAPLQVTLAGGVVLLLGAMECSGSSKAGGVLL